MIDLPQLLRSLVERVFACLRDRPPAVAERLVSADLLVRATRCERVHAERYADFLDDAAHRWGIAEPVRLASWLAQLAYESTLFARTEEVLEYTTAARLIAVWPSRFRLPVTAREESLEVFGDGKRNARFYLRAGEHLANVVYGARLGNGPEASGDGWRYRGRGLVMLTGRANYAAYGDAAGQRAIENPDLVAAPFGACDAAGWFWHANDLNRFADAQDWTGLSRAINGGTIGIDARRAMVLAALETLA